MMGDIMIQNKIMQIDTPGGLAITILGGKLVFEYQLFSLFFQNISLHTQR